MRFKVDIKAHKNFKKESHRRMIFRESIFLTKIAWMRYYQWQRGDTPFGGMDYLQKMNYDDGIADISENNNFIDFGGVCFGKFQTKGNSPHIEKIEGASKNSENVDDVLVIFCASNPEREGMYETNIVGRYANATVYRYTHKNEDYGIDYNLCAKSRNCVLLPEDERKDNKIWFLPQNIGSEINFGQSMYKFPKKSAPELKNVLQAIANYERGNWCGKFNLQNILRR